MPQPASFQAHCIHARNTNVSPSVVKLSRSPPKPSIQLLTSPSEPSIWMNTVTTSTQEKKYGR